MKINRLSDTSQAVDVAISPDGEFVAFIKEEKGSQSLWLRQISAPSSVQIVSPADDVRFGSPTFSTDGSYVHYLKTKSENVRATLYQIPKLGGEAYLKLVDKNDLDFEDRNHFFAIAATAMRRILVDYARTRKRKKRGGKYENLPLEEARYVSTNNKSVDLVALDEALNELATFDERQAKVVELKYFGGMTNDETAEVLDISNVTVRRDWNLAKAWLHRQIKN